MPILFDIIETTKIEKGIDSFEIRLLKRDDDWGVDSTRSMEPTFGYSEDGARRTYKELCDSHSQ